MATKSTARPNNGGKNGNGGIIELTKEQIAKLDRAAPHLTLDQIGDLIGIHRNTFVNIRKKEPAIDSIYRRKRAEYLMDTSEKHHNHAVTDNAKGDRGALEFILKTQGNRAFAKEPDIHIESASNESVEELAYRIKDTKRYIKFKKDNPIEGDDEG